MKKNQNIIPDEMLVRYMLDETTEAEKAMVLQWLNEQKENKRYYNDLKLIWKESGKLAPVSEVDTDEAWIRFRQLVKRPKSAAPTKGRVYPLKWLSAAAVLLLMAGVGGYMWMQSKEKTIAMVAPLPAPVASVAANETPAAKTDVAQTNDPSPAVEIIPARPGSAPKINVPKKAIVTKAKWEPLKVNDTWLSDISRTKDFVCNATPCPIEICIIQMIQCENRQPSTVASCNTLQPDQAGQLHFNTLANTTNDCNASVEEIRIKRVTTGETIVLNSHSKPATAQDLFNYLTGQKQGDILAGVFQSDCNDQCNETKLILGKDFGHLIFQ